jgi:hypothetical protein
MESNLYFQGFHRFLKSPGPNHPVVPRLIAMDGIRCMHENCWSPVHIEGCDNFCPNNGTFSDTAYHNTALEFANKRTTASKSASMNATNSLWPGPEVHGLVLQFPGYSFFH